MHKPISRMSLVIGGCLLMFSACGGNDFTNFDQDGSAGGGPGGWNYDALINPNLDGVGGTANPYDPDNATKDTDCDGISDEEEFAMVYPGNKKTDPMKADSDGDGIIDGVEIGKTASVAANCNFVGDADPASKTNPTEADSDVDGLPDGIEDANHDGKVDANETNPNNPDGDSDGIKDGDEDKNHNGLVDADETDPRKKDTDGDKISDSSEIKTTKTNPTVADTDGDGCLDGDEDKNQNGVLDSGETNPNTKDCGGSVVIVDTDKDGLPDNIEDPNNNGVVNPGETDPKKEDTDGDGIKDGTEDKNHNGKVDAGETNPLRVDSDCDGLADGVEDANKNGIVDAGETNPTKNDTDGDGLPDGLEKKITTNPDPVNCPNVKLDADTSTGTDPLLADSDGDGILDGSEDANQNGKVDAGELNPGNGTDGTGPAGKVCTTANLTPINFHNQVAADLQLALTTDFTEVNPMVVSNVTRGLIGYNPTKNVAFVAFRLPAPTGSTTPTADETSYRAKLNTVGALSNPTTQTFTTWDKYPALQAFYDQAGTGDIKTQANNIANSLVGTGAGSLTGTGGITGPFKIQAEYVHRSAQSVVVVIALVPSTKYIEPQIFTVGDLAGGTALAQFGDGNATQCELFTTTAGIVDFLFVVDNSGSMASSQLALANTGTAMATSLANSTLDWRIAMVTTTYAYGSGTGGAVIRGFTRNIKEFQGWLTQNNNCSGGYCSLSGNTIPCTSNDQCWVNTSGSSSERSLESAAKAVSNLSPGSSTEIASKMRANAKLVVILLGDADDQSSYNATQYSNFFNNVASSPIGTYTNKTGNKIPVHGIICPAGVSCNGETQQNPQRNGATITATGGIRGDISTPASIAATMTQIVNTTIGSSGYHLLKPPIGASVKVALDATRGTCTKDNIPRSRVNGFDVDGLNLTIAFYGNCRPPESTTGTPGAVSYKYWIDNTANPDSNKVPCVNDPYFDASQSDFCKGRLVCNTTTDVCECPADCGGNIPAGKICNTNRAVCDFVCTPDCGGSCSIFQTCNQTTCECQCVTNASCQAGYVFSTEKCGCECSAAALACDERHQADLTTCSCACKADCGGCATGKCNMSTCTCEASPI